MDIRFGVKVMQSCGHGDVLRRERDRRARVCFGGDDEMRLDACTRNSQSGNQLVGLGARGNSTTPVTSLSGSFRGQVWLFSGYGKTFIRFKALRHTKRGERSARKMCLTKAAGPVAFQ